MMVKTFDDIFDVKKCLYGIVDIEPFTQLEHLHNETLAEQSACKRIWLRDRSELHERLYWDEGILKKWQLQRIIKLVDWAYSTTVFYRELYDSVGYEIGGIQSFSDFEKLPIINRKDLVDNFPWRIKSSEYDVQECKWTSSSGSSGQPVEIWLQKSRTFYDTVFRYRQFEYMSNYYLKPKDWIYNIHHAPWWYSSFNSDYPVFTVSQDCPAHVVYEHIKKIRPVFIALITSFLPQLADVAENLSRFGVKLVSTNSEASSRVARSAYSQHLGVPVLDEYSSEELDMIACECPFGAYHVVEDETLVELVDCSHDGVGSVLGTDLWNYANPIIRYEQGDLARWHNSSERCQCGSGHRVLTNVHGRKDDIFYSKIYGKIPTSSLLDICDYSFCKEMPSFQNEANNPNVAQYKLIQHNYDEIQVLYIPHETDKMINHIAKNDFQIRVSELFGYSVNIKFDKVDKIPPSGKYKHKVLLNCMDMQILDNTLI
jgi:phenylacetate-CoA ligase